MNNKDTFLEQKIRKPNVLENILNSPEFLAAWSQNELTSQIADVVLHFLLNFSSNNTKKSYLYDIKEFINYAESININVQYISQIDEKLLILWHDYLLKENKFLQKTIRRKLHSMSSLLEFCKKRKLIDNNPMQFIQKPKLEQVSRTNAFTLEEVKKILNYLQQECTKYEIQNINSRKYKNSLLKYTVIVTLFSVGMRVNELCNLKIEDIEFASDFTRIHLTTKGSKEHAPIIHQKTSVCIKNYINIMRKNANEKSYLFARIQNVEKNTKLSQVAVYKMINEVAKSVGIEKKVSPHSCRASLATILHNQGIPIGQIQALLNHKDISTTAIYIKKANELEESATLKLDLSKFNND